MKSYYQKQSDYPPDYQAAHRGADFPMDPGDCRISSSAADQAAAATD